MNYFKGLLIGIFYMVSSPIMGADAFNLDLTQEELARIESKNRRLTFQEFDAAYIKQNKPFHSFENHQGRLWDVFKLYQKWKKKNGERTPLFSWELEEENISLRDAGVEQCELCGCGSVQSLNRISHDLVRKTHYYVGSECIRHATKSKAELYDDFVQSLPKVLEQAIRTAKKERQDRLDAIREEGERRLAAGEAAEDDGDFQILTRSQSAKLRRSSNSESSGFASQSTVVAPAKPAYRATSRERDVLESDSDVPSSASAHRGASQLFSTPCFASASPAPDSRKRPREAMTTPQTSKARTVLTPGGAVVMQEGTPPYSYNSSELHPQRRSNVSRALFPQTSALALWQKNWNRNYVRILTSRRATIFKRGKGWKYVVDNIFSDPYSSPEAAAEAFERRLYR